MNHAQDISTNIRSHCYYLYSDYGIHVTRYQSFESANERASKFVSWESGNVIIFRQNTPFFGTEPLGTDTQKIRVWTTRGDIRDFDVYGNIFDIHHSPDDVRLRLGTDKWELPISCVESAQDNRVRNGYPCTDVFVE